jgi:hypothetical protein
MARTILYRLFGAGKIPAMLRAALTNEGVRLLDEGIRGSVTYRGFRASGKRFAYKRKWFTASIALTDVRLLGLANSETIIDVPWTDPRLRQMQFSIEGDDVLNVAFDAALFRDDWSGAVEYRFLTAQARDFKEMLDKRTD